MKKQSATARRDEGRAGHRVDEMLDKRHAKKREDEAAGGRKANRELDKRHDKKHADAGGMMGNKGSSSLGPNGSPGGAVGSPSSPLPLNDAQHGPE